MMENLSTRYEQGPNGLEKTIENAIKEKMFSPATILLMISQSPQKITWMEKYLNNPETSTADLMSVVKDLETMGKTPEFQQFIDEVVSTIMQRKDFPNGERTRLINERLTKEEELSDIPDGDAQERA